MGTKRIAATELARSLGDILSRIRYRGESFIVEKNGMAVARLAPLTEGEAPTVADAFSAWKNKRRPDPAFAKDLERVSSADLPPENAWGS